MAGSGRRVFTPGEVLTASNVMNYLQDQTVMNFAGTAARGSAIGTAVSEGMVSYLADSNDVEVYRAIGTAAPGWNPVAFRSEVTALPKPGLVPVIAPTVNFSGGTATANSLGEIAFTSVSSISLNNVFNSTYTNYKIKLRFGVSGQSNTDLRFRYRAGGSDATTNGAQAAMSQAESAGYVAYIAASISYMTFCEAGTTTDQRYGAEINVRAPNTTAIKGLDWLGQGFRPGTGNAVYTGAHFLNSTTQFDGFTIYPAGNTITGTVTVYGYNS